MSKLEFKKIGVDPVEEADLLHILCISEGIDEAIRSEFPETIATYSQRPTETAVKRIIDRYAGCTPRALGSIVLADSVPIGLAYSGVAEYQRREDHEAVSGINVSSWLLRPYRKMGVGSSMINHAAQEAANQAISADAHNWYGKRIWTSIKIGNLASERACERAGFAYSGIAKDDTHRAIYFLGA